MVLSLNTSFLMSRWYGSIEMRQISCYVVWLFKKKYPVMQVFNPRSGLCDDQKNVEGCQETYPDEPRELDIEVGELFTSVTIYLGQISFAYRSRWANFLLLLQFTLVRFLCTLFVSLLSILFWCGRIL
jgi:hypothetical protein